ncbi:MAG TPA: serine protease [Xanthobacteraceae bacterium]
MRLGLLSFFFVMVLSAPSWAATGCIDPATLVRSTASITRYFGDEEKEARPGVLGMSGSGWFLSPTLMVTVEHVAAAMKLSDQTWKQVDVWTGENKQSVGMRLRGLAGSYAEKIAVLELQAAFPDAQGFQPRAKPLLPEEPLVSLAYPDERLRVATGRFVQYGDGDKFPGMALLEMYDGNDRLVLDHGSSGAAVLDCEGRVVAVVSKLFVSTIYFMSQAIRIPTGWGSPNVVSLPVGGLRDFARAE